MDEEGLPYKRTQWETDQVGVIERKTNEEFYWLLSVECAYTLGHGEAAVWKYDDEEGRGCSGNEVVQTEDVRYRVFHDGPDDERKTRMI